MHSSIHTFIHSYIHAFIHSSIPPFIHSFIHPSRFSLPRVRRVAISSAPMQHPNPSSLSRLLPALLPSSVVASVAASPASTPWADLQEPDYSNNSHRRIFRYTAKNVERDCARVVIPVFLVDVSIFKGWYTRLNIILYIRERLLHFLGARDVQIPSSSVRHIFFGL